MKEVITKAIAKGQAKNLPPERIADMVLDLMDILADESPNTLVLPKVEQVTAPAPVQNQVVAAIQDSNSITAPAAVNRIITKAASEDLPVWTTEALSLALGSVQWEFSANPEGFKIPLEYKGTMVQNPRGQQGVGVVFTCPDVSTPREFNIFFGLNEKTIDPAARIQEVKSQVEQLFRVRSTPISNSTKPLTSFPSIDAIINGGGAVFGGDV